MITDKVRIQQVLRNYISNAIKFTEPAKDGSSKSITTTVGYDWTNEHLNIRVVDEGIGLSEG